MAELQQGDGAGHGTAVERATSYIGLPRPLFTRLPFDYRLVPLPLRVVALRVLLKAARSRHAAASPRRPGAAVHENAPARPGPTSRDSSLLITHDIDTGSEMSSIERIRLVERRTGAVSSWGFVPASSWPSEATARSLVAEGCEVYWHDMKHDGRLPYQSLEHIRRQFLEVDQQSPWARDLMRAFRSGQMLMSPALLEAVAERFEIDMSIPYLEEGGPYGGAVGCLEVHPFRLGGVLEIPLTLTQDVYLRGVRRLSPDDTVDTWLEELEYVRADGGVAVLNAHPVWLGGPMLAAYARFLEACRDMTTTTPTAIARALT